MKRRSSLSRKMVAMQESWLLGKGLLEQKVRLREMVQMVERMEHWVPAPGHSAVMMAPEALRMERSGRRKGLSVTMPLAVMRGPQAQKIEQTEPMKPQLVQQTDRPVLGLEQFVGVMMALGQQLLLELHMNQSMYAMSQDDATSCYEELEQQK